jgi:hypothetical protein
VDAETIAAVKVRCSIRDELFLTRATG